MCQAEEFGEYRAALEEGHARFPRVVRRVALFRLFRIERRHGDLDRGIRVRGFPGRNWVFMQAKSGLLHRGRGSKE